MEMGGGANGERMAYEQRVHGRGSGWRWCVSFFYSVFAALELCSCEEHYKPRGVRRRARWVRLRALKGEEGAGVRSLASHIESWPSNLV